MYADMIFKFGYVHCDPHPGNVLVRKDRATGRPQIVLLDHGLYTVSSKSLSPQQFSMRNVMKDLICCMCINRGPRRRC